jgi:hypothetical protein
MERICNKTPLTSLLTLNLAFPLPERERVMKKEMGLYWQRWGGFINKLP